MNQIHLNGGVKTQNKENESSNKNSDNNNELLGEAAHAGDEEQYTKSTIEKRIDRFFQNLSNKLKTYVRDNKGSIQNPKTIMKDSEEYVRSLSPEELEKFLSENEQEYGPLPDNSEKSFNGEGEVQHHEDVKSASSASEIPQEEIILMTNLDSVFTADTAVACTSKLFGEYFTL